MKNDSIHLKVAKKIAKVFPTSLVLSEFICEVQESYLCLSYGKEMKKCINDQFDHAEDCLWYLNTLLFSFIKSENEPCKNGELNHINDWVVGLENNFGFTQTLQYFIQLYGILLLDHEDAPITDVKRKDLVTSAIALYSAFIIPEKEEVKNV